MTVRIAYAENKTLIRNGFIALLESLNMDVTIVIAASDGKELIGQIEQLRNPPDLIMMSVAMPVMDAYKTLPLLKKKWPEIPVIIVSIVDGSYCVQKLIQLGSISFLNSDVTPSELRQCITEVTTKGFFIPESRKREIHKALFHRTAALPDISHTERTFLSFACKGLSYNEIANCMNVSKRTVEGYRDSLFTKLDICDRGTLIAFAFQNGLDILDAPA